MAAGYKENQPPPWIHQPMDTQGHISHLHAHEAIRATPMDTQGHTSHPIDTLGHTSHPHKHTGTYQQPPQTYKDAPATPMDTLGHRATPTEIAGHTQTLPRGPPLNKAAIHLLSGPEARLSAASGENLLYIYLYASLQQPHRARLT